jgi:hypothetical protein
MAKTTVTEGLAEILTISKRLETRRANCGQYLMRDARLKDPLESDGGSQKYVTEERQAVKDLEERIVQIRTAIQKSNLSTYLKIQGIDRPVQAWLNWRREVSPGQKLFLANLRRGIDQGRKDVQSKGMKLKEGSVGDSGDVLVALNEKDLNEEIEKLDLILGELDGKLSLTNALTTIEV